MLLFSIYFITAVVFSIVYFALNNTLKNSILAGIIWPVTASILSAALLIAFFRELIHYFLDGRQKPTVQH